MRLIQPFEGNLNIDVMRSRNRTVYGQGEQPLQNNTSKSGMLYGGEKRFKIQPAKCLILVIRCLIYENNKNIMLYNC